MSESRSSDVVFLPLGGCGEIGMNFNLFGHADQWIAVDCGITLEEVNQLKMLGLGLGVHTLKSRWRSDSIRPMADLASLGLTMSRQPIETVEENTSRQWLSMSPPAQCGRRRHWPNGKGRRNPRGVLDRGNSMRP